MAVTLPEVQVDGAAPAAAPAPAPAPAPEVLSVEPGYVAVTSGDGKVEQLPQENLAAAQQAGYRPATRAELWAERAGTAGQAVAAADAFARGATFGLSDAAQVGIAGAIGGDAEAENVRRQTAYARDAHKGTALAGELAGSLVPMALGLPGGGGAAAIEETGMLARAGARVLATAPRAFAEGAIIGAGQQLSEDVLGDHELAAQKYLAASLKGGLMGAVIGGGLSAGFGAVGDKLALRAEQAAERAGLAESGGPFRALGKVGDAARPKATLGRLSEFAEEQAAKGAMPSASLAGSEMQKLGATAEAQQTRIRRIGRTLLDEGITTPGATKAVQAQRLTARAKEVGEELGALRSRLDESAIRPSAATILKRVNDEVIAPMMGASFNGPQRAAVLPVLDELTTKLGGKIEAVENELGGQSWKVTLGRETVDSFEALHKLRRDLDGQLKWDKGIPPPTPALKELRAIRGILEDEFESAAGRAAADLGDDVAAKYQTAKALYADLKTAEKWATKGAARDAQNRAISLTDTIMAGAALMSGHPAALAAPIANKALRTYGNQVAATIADRATRIEAVQRAAAAWDTKLDAAVLAFFGKGKPPALSGARAGEKVTPEAARALRDAVKNPSVLADRVASAVASTGMRESAPRVTQAMTSTIMRAATWLQQKLPPEPPPRGLQFGPPKPRPLGPKAQKEVDNAFRALDADAFVDDLARGRVDRQSLEALKFINPAIYGQVIGKLTQYGIENRPDLTRQQAVALSIITGTPLTPLMQPSTIQGFQQAFAQDGPPHDPSAPGQTEKKQIGSGGPPPGRGQSTRAFASGTDKMEASNGQ